MKAESNVSALSWSDALNISRPTHHGGKFNGNPVKKLLSSTGTLETILKEANVHESCLSLVAVLHAFKEVVDKCFGKHVVPGYKEAICSFSQLYRKVVGLSVTPKVHCLEAHVGQFLDMQKEKYNGFGLGYWSEQASESVHFDFKHLWVDRGYKRDLQHSDYDSNFLKCVVTYNSRHM